MVDGILPVVMASVREASDSHTKYHALCILEIALQHWRKYLADRHKEMDHKGKTGEASGLGMGEDGNKDKQEDDESHTIGCDMFDDSAAEEEEEDAEALDESKKGDDQEQSKGSSVQGAANGVDSAAPTGTQKESHLLEDEHMMDLVDLLSSSWEDPLVQTTKVAQSCFGYIVEIQELQSHILRKDTRAFTLTLCRKLLAMGFYRKGIYTALTCIVNRIGARRLLDIEPNILKETIETTKGTSSLVASSTFLKTFLHSLYLESSSATVWRETWQEALISSMLSTEQAARQNIAMYILPIPLEIDSSSFYYILRSLLEGLSDFWSMKLIGVVVLILKRAKELDLIRNLDTTVKCSGGGRVAGGSKDIRVCNILLARICQN
jgi:hypothetical protein